MGEKATIDDAAIERLRQRIGVPTPNPQPPHYRVVTSDVFRHVAEAYGDDNPLWCDPLYASSTRWEGPLAPPPLVGGDTLVGEDEVPSVPTEHAELMRGDPLRGVHAFYAASAREWWAPLRPGMSVRRRNALVGVLDKASEFADRAVHEWTGQVFRDEDGPLLSGQYRLMVRTERSKARSKAKDRSAAGNGSVTSDAAPGDVYTDEQIAEIEAQYAAESARGLGRSWEGWSRSSSNFTPSRSLGL
jgi:acyl dehydratase